MGYDHTEMGYDHLGIVAISQNVLAVIKVKP